MSITFGSLLTVFFGTWIPLMTTLIVLNITDILTGLLKGGILKTIGSNKFYQGIKKKVGQWILIIVANAIDTIAFDSIPAAKTVVVSSLIATEGISITENLAQMGVWIPEPIKKYLAQIRQKNEDVELVAKSESIKK